MFGHSASFGLDASLKPPAAGVCQAHMLSGELVNRPEKRVVALGCKSETVTTALSCQ